MRNVEQLIEEARSSPECFKCHEPITEFSEVRIVTVRVDGDPLNVWVHADHVNPEWRPVSHPSCETCDLAKQIEDCGPELLGITEVPPSRHAWGDVAACPTDGCGRQFMFTRAPSVAS